MFDIIDARCSHEVHHMILLCLQVLLDCLTYYFCGRCSSFSTTVSGNRSSGLLAISGHFYYSMAWLELYCQKYFGFGMLILTYLLIDSVLPVIKSYVMTYFSLYCFSIVISQWKQCLLIQKGYVSHFFSYVLRMCSYVRMHKCIVFFLILLIINGPYFFCMLQCIEQELLF